MTTMKKKIYMSPVVEMLEMKPQKLLAGSIVTTDCGDLNITIEDPIPGDAGDAAVPGFDPFGPLNMFMTIIVLLMMSLSISAQGINTVEPAGPAPDGKTHGMKIYLRSGGEPVEYDFDELSHVTYLPGIGMKVYLKNATTSVDYLFSQMTKIDYIEDANANANWRVVSGFQPEMRLYISTGWISRKIVIPQRTGVLRYPAGIISRPKRA